MIVRSWGDDRFNNSSFDQVEMIAGIFSSTYALLDASRPRPWYAAYPKKPATKRTRTRNRPPIIERNLFNVCTSPIGRYRRLTRTVRTACFNGKPDGNHEDQGASARDKVRVELEEVYRRLQPKQRPKVQRESERHRNLQLLPALCLEDFNDPLFGP